VFLQPSSETQDDPIYATQLSRDDVVGLVGDPISTGGSSSASPATVTLAAELQEVGLLLAGSPASPFAPPPLSSSPTPPSLETATLVEAGSPLGDGVIVTPVGCGTNQEAAATSEGVQVLNQSEMEERNTAE
jgi:hypothetical protein